MTTPNYPHFPNRRLLPILLAAAVITLAGALSAQDDSDDQEVIELSPFVVETSGDRGYLSTNSTSGTSLNTLIRDLPIPLEVVNRELIEDLQANDMKEALEYSAGVHMTSFQNTTGAVSNFADSSPSSVNLNAEFTNTISLRGYTVPNTQRLGFRVGALVPAYGVVLGGSTDTVTSERIEVIRGPQALLYGINVLSGVVNVMPREPLFSQGTSIGLSIGSYDYLRFTLDNTGPILDGKLAYRVMGAYTEEGHWTQFQETEREDYALQFLWRMLPGTELFVEGKHSTYHRQGIGARYFIDNDPTTSRAWSWENEFGENITFGRDPIDVPVYSDDGTAFDSPFIERTDFQYPEKFYDLGPNYRISGPDTYFDRKESTLTALLRSNITEQLSSELGLYYVTQEEETFDVNLRTFTDTRGTTIPQRAPSPGVFGRPPTVTMLQNSWFNNPEVSLDGSRGPIDVVGDPLYAVTFGIGDPFIFPIRILSAGGGFPTPPPRITVGDRDNPDDYSRKYARYIWYKRPLEAESIQLRGRLAYTVDSDFFGEKANHTFSGGASYIADTIDFVSASVTDRNDNHVYSGHHVGNGLGGKQDNDPYYFRPSVFDFTPMRYNGENVALLMTPNYNQLEGLSTGGTSGTTGGHIARSGHKEATLWYRGYYGLYHGKYFDERLHLILGMRHDQYQVKESEQLVIVDQLRSSDVWQGTENPVTPWLIGNGRGEYQSPAGIPDALDERVRSDYALLQELQPEGTQEHLFDGYQKFNTGTIGTSYRIIDPLSLYALYSEGVFPNTGQRDGNMDPIDAEQTQSYEIGTKFDLFDGKLSGTISAYKIKRENAVHYWGSAPSPATWQGGINGPIDPNNGAPFSPANAIGPGSAYITGLYLPVAYSVAIDYMEQAFEEMGMADEFPLTPGGPLDPNAFNKWGAEFLGGSGAEGAIAFMTRTYVTVRYDTLINDPNAAVLKRAFDIALRTDDLISFPFVYQGHSTLERNNPSNPGSIGSNVLFEEEGQGIDGQLIYSPIPNYQIVFSFSYQEREVTNLIMVDAVDQVSGINFGTEYDLWVYLLGVDNFTDPSRASTFTGGGLKGVDLSFVPQTSASLWNKYRFTEGPLENVEIGGGIKYIGSAATSTGIGGSRLQENRYRTPDTKERFEVDFFASYRFSFMGYPWRVALRVSNLFDDKEDTVTAHYDNLFGGEEVRRTRIYHAPRTWRLQLSMQF